MSVCLQLVSMAWLLRSVFTCFELGAACLFINCCCLYDIAECSSGRVRRCFLRLCIELFYVVDKSFLLFLYLYYPYSFGALSIQLVCILFNNVASCGLITLQDQNKTHSETML